MAVPKRKKSQAKKNSRRANHQRAPLVTINNCPRCREPKYPHRVCANCGYYGGKDVLRLEKGA